MPSSDPGNYISTQWGLSTDVPISASDFDGDGKTDLAVWRPETGTWYIVPSSDPGNYVSILWGMQPDNPVSGDYDGDGVDDVAVKRSSTGLWYVRPSLSPETIITQSDPSLVTGSIISIYGPGNELLVEYKSETGPSGSNIWQTNHILNGSTAIAKETTPQSGAPSTEYMHRNHLSQVVDPINYSIGYGIDSAYGRPFGSGGDDQFSGHKDDAESGLHYNLARSYNSIMSRWPSPDKVTKTFDPQSLNKYAYNRNDPINRVDPDGRDGFYINGGTVWAPQYEEPVNWYYTYYMVEWGYFMNDYILWSHGTFYQPTSYPQSGSSGGGGGGEWNPISPEIQGFDKQQQSQFDKAYYTMLSLLGKDSCAAVFGSNVITALSQMSFIYDYVESIVWNDVLLIQSKDITSSYNQYTRTITINTAGNCFDMDKGSLARQTRLYGDNLRTLALLHELGHATGIFEDDYYDDAQIRNNNLVLGGCFPGHEIEESRKRKGRR